MASTAASPLPKSAALTNYKKSYQKRGQVDPYEPMFAALSEFLSEDPPKKVLYPGCHRHITASFFFPHVDYVDCDKKVGDVFEDSAVQTFVHDRYSQIGNQKDDDVPTWTFTCSTYDALERNTSCRNLLQNSFDLIISLSAGLVSEPCRNYAKEGKGYLLVNDSHGDASWAYAYCQADWKLVAAYHAETNTFSTESLDDYFLARVSSSKRGKNNNSKPLPMSKAQAKEACEIGSKSKRSFRLVKESDAYLFQRVRKQSKGKKRKALST